MKITPEQAADLLPAFKRAVAGIVAEWNACREIERAVGHDFSNMSEALGHYAFAIDEPEDAYDKLTVEDVQTFMTMIDDDGAHDDEDDTPTDHCEDCGEVVPEGSGERRVLCNRHSSKECDNHSDE